MAVTFGAQKEFAEWFAFYSGLNVDVVTAWVIQEQPPGSPATPGSNNWLNIQYTDSGPNSTYYEIARLNPKAAAERSVAWMEHNQPTIPASRTQDAKGQAEAIVNSGWASSHYGGIAKFYGVVQSVAGQVHAKTSPGAPNQALPPGQKATLHVSRTGSQANPPDHSHKVYVSGKSFGEHGSHMAGHLAAMRDLKTRQVRFYVQR